MNNELKWTEEKLLQIRPWTDKLLSFTISRPPAYRFVPGQYSRLGLRNDDGQLIWRAFSVVSAPHQDFLEYYGVIVPGGMFTTRLARCVEGDPIWLDKHQFGFMTADRFKDGETLWMLSTGTGLGPYVSMLRDAAVWKQFPSIVLAHCARHVDELSYADELQAMQQDSSGQLCYVRSVTRDSGDAAAGILHGRLTTLLENGELERAAGRTMTPETARVMLCGNPDMIEEMRAMLHARGMRPLRRASPGQFVTENYW